MRRIAFASPPSEETGEAIVWGRDLRWWVLGAEIVEFGAGRKAARIGRHKLNLHDAASRGDPVARNPGVGGADPCILTETPIAEVVRHLEGLAVEIVAGPVERTGAMGPILSVYIRDPDGSLIEISNPLAARSGT